MSACYDEEQLDFSEPLFARVPLTIVLTMWNSSRRPQYMQQLLEFRPTSRVIVLHNHGFERCQKQNVNHSALDLWHANVYAASLAAGGPALILEDDVQFLPRIREAAANIEQFLLSQSMPCAYNLGCCPFLSLPHRQHTRVVFGADAHAVLYNASALQRFPRISIRWLHDLELYRQLRTFTCKRPCAVQHKSATDNSAVYNVLGLPLLFYAALGRGCAVTYYERVHCTARAGGLLPTTLAILVVLVSAIRRVTYTPGIAT